MKSGKVLLTFKETDMFDRAVRERAIAQVTLCGEDGWKSFKCRFLERDANRRFFVLDFVPQPGTELPSISLGQYVGVSFRSASRKIMLSTVVEAKGRFVTSDDGEIPAIRYRWPQAVTELQRRSFYRTIVPESLNLIASAWLGGTARRTSAQATPLQILTGKLLDLSCGGTLIRLNESRPPNWGIGDNIGLELGLGDNKPPIQVDAFYRGHRQDEQGRTCIAVQFVGLELSVDGKVTISRLSGAVQRLNRMSPSACSTSRSRTESEH